MLRAPIWMTSAHAPTASACWTSSSSVTIGSPVSARASARISRPSIPSPLNENGDVLGLNAPPRSIEAPALATARATARVCSRDSTVHGPAIRQNVSPPPTTRPSTRRIVGSSWASSDEASLYGRLMGTTRSTPAIPSSPSSATPSGSPIAPIAVVSSPGITSTCRWPIDSSRALTAPISSAVACGVITIIMARSSCGLEPQPPYALLVPTQVVGQLVAHRPCDLGLQEIRVVAEVAQQRVAEDDDPVVEVVTRDRVPLVETVGALSAPAVGDDHGDVLERAVELEREVVERGTDERAEVL